MTTIITMCTNLLLASVNGLDCTHVPTAPPLVAEAAVFLTVYDTALCEDDEETCLQGNGDGYFATMIPISADWYGRMAACPPEFLGYTIQVLDMELFCGDTFGSLDGQPVETLGYSDEVGWYVRVDVFWPVAEKGTPSWNAWFVSHWNHNIPVNAN